MKRPVTDNQPILAAVTLPAVIFFMCFAGSAGAQQSVTASSQNPATADQRIPPILLPATLTAALDSKKEKPGDEVVLKCVAIVQLADKRLIPRGAKIVGHVTEATIRSRSEAQSSLGIVLDKIDLADGNQLSINGRILAVAPNLNPPDADHQGISYGDITQTVTRSTPTAGGFNKVIPILTEDSVGVQGIKNLQLGGDGVFKSDQRSVKLGFGLQILVKAQATAGS